MQIYADADSVAVAVTVAARLELSFVEARSQCGKGKQCIILWCEKGVGSNRRFSIERGHHQDASSVGRVGIPGVPGLHAEV